MDDGMQGDHGLGHVIAGGIGVEAAVDVAPLVEQRGQPNGIGSGAGGGDAAAASIKGRATDGVDGRFAENNC